MLEVALHTPTRHVQAVLAPEGMVLFRPPNGDWAIKAPSGKEPRAEWIELVSDGEGIRLKTSLNLVGLTAGGQPANWKSEINLALPLRFVAGDTRVEIVDSKLQQSIRELVPLSVHGDAEAGSMPSPAPGTLTRWFEALTALNRWPADSQEFYRSAAELVIDPIGLDGAYVLTRSKNTQAWDFAAAILPRFEQCAWFDLRLLDCLNESITTWFHPSSSTSQTADASYVVAPWTSATGEVSGAIVGKRSLHKNNSRVGMRPLEAHLVSLLAKTMGDIEARREQEAESLRRRILLRHTFTGELAERIEKEPSILKGSAREVSLLFADLREASSLFHDVEESTGKPLSSFELLSEVLDALTEEVLSRAGVVIDYYGDGLAAMWNAPIDQPDHAQRACAAGLAMVDAITNISTRWFERLGYSLEVGVGIHTGSAVVGDIGSRWKIKYGARGAAVNLASRVEQTTKTIGLPLLITETTQTGLGAEYASQRICRGQLAGFPEGVPLYALWRQDSIPCIGINPTCYAEALALFEEGRLDPALRKLTKDSDEKLTGAAAFLAEKIRQARHERRGRRLSDLVPSTIDSVIDLSNMN